MTTIVSGQYQAGSDYVLSRDESERDRLNEQHAYMKIMMYENRLIYDKEIQLDPGSQVLDCGTGTGIWLIDLSKQVSASVQLYGCDVSSNNFSKNTADNIHFRLASVTDLPPEWANKFDFVNQRLLFGGLRASEWPVVLSEMYRVLRPGGSLQLMELDFTEILGEGPATRRFRTLFAGMFVKRGLLHDCSSRLPDLLTQAKFVDVRSEKKYLVNGKAWGKLGGLGTTNLMGVFHNVIPAMLASGIKESEQDLVMLLKECKEEWDKSEEGIRVIGHVVRARKTSADD